MKILPNILCTLQNAHSLVETFLLAHLQRNTFFIFWFNSYLYKNKSYHFWSQYIINQDGLKLSLNIFKLVEVGLPNESFNFLVSGAEL